MARFPKVVKSMNYHANSVQSYLDALPADRREVIERLRTIIKENLPSGFEEGFSYGMIGFDVPLSIYPAGYKPTPGQPLPFIGLASQKNHIAIYHMGIFMVPELLEWFTDAYGKVMTTRLDMGKSCIRFKNLKTIPYDLIGELSRKMTVEEYVRRYEEATAGR